MAPYSSTLAWKIPWMEEPGRLHSTGSQRVRCWQINELRGAWLRVLQFILSVPSMTSLFWLQCEAGTENWQRVNTELPVKSPRFALFDLAEGKSYRFRVRCSNSAGVGEPSEATEVTVVGDKLGKCRVCLSCYKLI